jgi:hypothetical protein
MLLWVAGKAVARAVEYSGRGAGLKEKIMTSVLGHVGFTPVLQVGVRIVPTMQF